MGAGLRHNGDVRHCVLSQTHRQDHVVHVGPGVEHLEYSVETAIVLWTIYGQ
jgi:hypothetical protein